MFSVDAAANADDSRCCGVAAAAVDAVDAVDVVAVAADAVAVAADVAAQLVRRA